jgi:hypothetical protein
MPRPSLTALLAIAAALTALAALTAALGDPERAERPVASTPAPPDRTPAPIITPVPPRLSRREVNRQDRISAAQRRRESRALDDRPLLAELPLELGQVTIDLAGQAPDQRRALLTLTGPDEHTARRVYRQTLRALGDPGTAYQVRWAP